MLHFRDIRLDGATRRLWRGSQEIKVTRKAFDLLDLLIERRPAVVSKEEIHQRLWPSTFVAEITLHSLVSELRAALQDESRRPRFIRTVHGLGYAFITPVEEDGRDSPAEARRLRGWLIGDAGRLSLFDGENVLGRGVEDVIELGSPTVSRHHASIRFDSDAWLADLGSKNGTFIGDAPVTVPVRLTDGDRVRVGSVLLTFRLSQATRAISTRSGAERHDSDLSD